MEIKLGSINDLDDWMSLVKKVKDNFPGLETIDALNEHRNTVLEFMGKKSAICAKSHNKIVGVLLFSRENHTLCFLAVDAEHRRQHIAESMVSYMLTMMDSKDDIIVTTYREGVPEGIAARAFYKRLGFEEGKLTEGFGSPVQEFILKRQHFSKKTKILFMIGNLVIIFLTLALLPLNLFVCNFPSWVVVLSGGIAILGSVIWPLLFRAKMAAKIFFPTAIVLLAVISSLVAYTIPYWNSFNFKTSRPKAMGFRETLTCSQAERDLDEVVYLLERIHPMFREGLTEEIQARYEEAREHLKAAPQITANDLRREIQWMMNPMHDAHTSTYNNYPDDRYLKVASQKFSEGYSVFSVNGLARDGFREMAKSYESYETEERLGVDVGSLASLDFYGITAPFTFVWKNEDGEQVTEIYTEDDFVLLDEYLAIRDSYTDTPATEKPFVWYEIDEEKSLAILTLTQCKTGAYYNDCVRKMFAEVKEKNIRNVAVDLRGNGGGNSGVANEFIRYLPVDEYGDSSFDWRWNFLTFHFDGRTKNNRYTELTFNGKVYVLTDYHSFSSAMLFPQMIQDNGLGMVIGESPANNVNSYGDIAYFYLKESGLFIQISTKKWYRIDTENPDEYVMPDIPCDGADALKKMYERIGESN